MSRVKLFFSSVAIIFSLCCLPMVTFGQKVESQDYPVQACWFWRESEFEPEGYKTFIDLAEENTPYDLISLSVRGRGREATKKEVHDQVKLAVEYAAQKGLSVVADLDVRLARTAFQEKYPDELQEMLLLKEVVLSSESLTNVVIHSKNNLSDHYTGSTVGYIPLMGELLRVYSYERNTNGIDPASLIDITDQCMVMVASKDSVSVTIPAGRNTKACVMASFTHFTPDVFAPHILEFQREIIQQYADIPLVGVFKDEWGFPPSFDGSPNKDQYWYSKHRSKAYAAETNGRDLLYDCLLMHAGIDGEEVERQRAINVFMEMSWQRNRDIEDDYYHAVKEIFGENAIVTTHPTWIPYPDSREQMKNGLDWWVVTRDLAQTDEITPYGVRTALSKKWNSPIWYNMYYATSREDYEFSVWSHALGGGRINYHPMYPSQLPGMERYKEMMCGDLMEAESKIDLLNYITKTPLDCPVAVVFGHACTMNWAGPAYDDAGMKILDDLWCAGIATDLIPTSEIENGSLTIDKEGWVCYGKQRYSAIVLYHPEFEKSSTATFFQRVKKGKTTLIRKGSWTKDFEARPFEGDKALPEFMVEMNNNDQIVTFIKTLVSDARRQTPAIKNENVFMERDLVAPATTGYTRLIDGTLIQIAATENRAGDPICSEIMIEGYPVNFDAVGVAAIRLDKKGNVMALAAGGLKQLKTKKMKIDLDERIDLALWKDEYGRWQGVLQGWQGEIPKPLLKITKNWIIKKKKNGNKNL